MGRASTDAGQGEGGASADRTSLLRRALASTRFRLAAALVLVMAVFGTLIVVGVRAVSLSQLEDRVRDELSLESRQFQRFIERGRDAAGRPLGGVDLGRAAVLYLGSRVLGKGEAVLVLSEDAGPVRSAGAPVDLAADAARVRAWAALQRTQTDSLDTSAGSAEVLAVPVRRGGRRVGTFVAASFTASARDEIDRITTVMAQATGAAVALVALLSWALAGRVLGPLSHMTAIAQRISQEDLSRRLKDPGGQGELARLVRTFNGMLDRLEEALTTQRTFLADASHDLRTPLTILRGHLEQLRAGLVPEAEREDTLTLVAEEIERMSHMVGDLTLLARARQPDFLRPAPVDLSDLALAVLRRAEALPGPAWRAEPGVGVVRADEERLIEAALNLVANAARYSPPGEPVTIGTALRDDTVLLWVGDSGPGIAPEERERIFDRFVRGPERQRSGSGLGLAIARAIAEAHGGTLAVSRAEEGGARFELSFPANEAP